MIERGAATIVRTTAELRAITDAVRSDGGTVGFLGTSGNLHVGHLTLIRRMVTECDLAIIPLPETAVQPVAGLLDLDGGLAGGYERNGAADRVLAQEAGVDIVFQPDMRDMYPRLPVQVHVVPNDELVSPWENAEDPAFVRMTATAVSKIWNVVGPCRYYAGEKDWVPLAVLRRIIDDLSFRVELVACPIVREADGVCASSRNAKLSEADRAAAPALYAALTEAVDLVERGEQRADAVEELLRSRIAAVATVDYAVVADPLTLQRVDPLSGDLRILVSADFSGIHLFDNVGVTAR